MKRSATRTQNISHDFRRPWMRVFLTVLLPVILASAVWEQTAAQQTGVPKLVQMKGVLKDQDGKPLTGVQGVTFALYKDEHEGAPLWVETQQVTPDDQGRFVALLGAMTAEGLPLELFTSGEAQWLGIQPAGQPEQPRAFWPACPTRLPLQARFRAMARSSGALRSPPLTR